MRPRSASSYNRAPGAVLIVTELLGWSAAEAALLVDASVPATNSLLQRARTVMRRVMVEVPRPSSDAVAAELLARYVDAHERSTDAGRFWRHRDVHVAMHDLFEFGHVAPITSAVRITPSGAHGRGSERRQQ